MIANLGIKTRPTRGKPIWRRCSDLEYRAMKALCSVTFPVGSGHKRFARGLGMDEITDKQAAYVWSLVWRYRRQISAADLVAHARRMSQPDVKGAFLQ